VGNNNSSASTYTFSEGAYNIPSSVCSISGSQRRATPLGLMACVGV